MEVGRLNLFFGDKLYFSYQFYRNDLSEYLMIIAPIMLHSVQGKEKKRKRERKINRLCFNFFFF